MAKKPAIQFYVGDWRKDPTVTCLSVAARGLWIEMLLMMFESPVRGYLLLESGQPMSIQQIARAGGAKDAREAQRLIEEMEHAGTFSRNEPGKEWYRGDVAEGAILNRRMVRDEKISSVRREAGSKGGNPALKSLTTGEDFGSALDNQNDNQNPTPSARKMKNEDSSSKKQEASENGSKGSAPNPIADPGWFEFRTQCEKAGMSGSEPDWDEAWRFEWKKLDFSQQKRAFDGIRDRIGTDDPALKALPRNYLKKRMWERAVQDRNGQQRPKESPRKPFELKLPPGVKLHE
jgi:hypothetical protein